MKHGYTNETSTDGRSVIKRYRGPNTDLRRRREVAIYSALAGQLPLPTLLDFDESSIVLERRPGVPGQELIEDEPELVLLTLGRLAKAVQEIDLDQLSLDVQAGSEDQVLVHGDFGPQNVLLEPVSGEPTALVDWEFAHTGDRVEDLAWAEWIVRTHHPHLIDHLPAMFDGFGHQSAWHDRHTAMIDKCRSMIAFVACWEPGDTSASRLWQQRLLATETFCE
jgi:hypothetical protein